MRSVLVDTIYHSTTITKYHDRGRHVGHFYLTPSSYRRLQRVCVAMRLQPLPVKGYRGFTGEVMYAQMGGAR